MRKDDSLSAATVRKQLISPIKRMNDVDKKIISREFEIFTCHRSIWSQKSKSADGKGLVRPPFEPKIERGDGSKPSCSVCSLSGHGRRGHTEENSRQCRLHCYTEAISNLEYVYRVRTSVAERVTDKTSFVIQLLCLWAGIDLQELVKLRQRQVLSGGSSIGHRRPRRAAREESETLEILQQRVRAKLRRCTTFYVPDFDHIDSCESVSSWAPSNQDIGSNSSCVAVCEMGFAMLTGIRPYRIRRAKELLRQGITVNVTKMAQRSFRSEARSGGASLKRGAWFRDWLQKTLPSVVQSYANGQKRIQDARFTSAVALARCAIAAYWSAPEHKSLALRRQALIDVELKKLTKEEANPGPGPAQAAPAPDKQVPAGPKVRQA